MQRLKVVSQLDSQPQATFNLTLEPHCNYLNGLTAAALSVPYLGCISAVPDLSSPASSTCSKRPPVELDLELDTERNSH